MSDFRVLIHPREDELLPVWEEWQEGECKTFPYGLLCDYQARVEKLRDVRYIKKLQAGTRIVLGGYATDGSVCLHASYLARSDDVLLRRVSVVVDSGALAIGNVQDLIEIIRRETGITLSVI